MSDEGQLRDQIKKEKERHLQSWGRPRKGSEDEFE